MKETHTFFDSIRGKADNIHCFAKVGNVMLVVGPIDVEGKKAVVVLNPNIDGYQETAREPFFGGTSSMQSISYQGGGPGGWLSQPVDVTIDGKRFAIRPVAFGHSGEGGEQRAYCDIEVEAIADIPGEA